MKNIFYALIFLSSFIQTSYAQKMNPEEVVQENLDFYNQRNINEFMKSFSEGIEVYNLGEVKPIIKGAPQVRKVYKQLFENSPKLHSTILKRIVIGNKVIDHESITGRNGSKEIVELTLIYEVENNKIVRITVIRK